jgi:hypothetical protein
MDKHLMFEHMLREHVNVQHERCRQVLADNGIGEYSQDVDLSYSGSDGGSWTAHKYLAKGSITFKAAELEAAVDGWIMLYEVQNRTKVLRSMIAGPQASIADGGNIPF